MCVVSAGVGGGKSQSRQAIVATAEHTTVTLKDIKSLSLLFVGSA